MLFEQSYTFFFFKFRMENFFSDLFPQCSLSLSVTLISSPVSQKILLICSMVPIQNIYTYTSVNGMLSSSKLIRGVKGAHNADITWLLKPKFQPLLSVRLSSVRQLRPYLRPPIIAVNSLSASRSSDHFFVIKILFGDCGWVGIYKRKIRGDKIRKKKENTLSTRKK